MPPAPAAARLTAPVPVEGTPTFNLADVLRLDISKEWVYQRWPRKSTALSELDLYGVRVHEPGVFHLVLDSTVLALGECVELIAAAARAHAR